MTWNDFYADYYEMPYAKKVHYIRELANFTSGEELVEVINDLGFDGKEKIAGELLLRAVNGGLRLTGEELVEISCTVTDSDIEKAVKACEDSFTADDLDDLMALIDYDWCLEICKKNKLNHPDFDLFEEEDEDIYIESFPQQKPPGLLSILGALLGSGLGGGSQRGGNRFNIGDHVYVIPRGQEGNIIDVVGDTYMVSIGNYRTVERYKESQLRRSF